MNKNNCWRRSLKNSWIVGDKREPLIHRFICDTCLTQKRVSQTLPLL